MNKRKKMARDVRNSTYEDFLSRADPAEEGDTCCGLRVNASQARAIHEACNGKVTLIQGPPGTGKTYTAALIVRKWLEETERTGDKVRETQDKGGIAMG